MDPQPTLSSVRVAFSSDGPQPPLDLPAATVRAVVHEAAHETVADHLRWYPDDDTVRYVDPPAPVHCAVGVECLPLAGVLALGPDTAGHLHRSGDRRPTGNGAPGLTALGELVAANVVRDLLDVRLARAQHDVDRLRIALETCQLQEFEADLPATGTPAGRRRAVS